ncbi:hypothetical protein [Helicobacter suis]|uniref:hypothetical protein n=1 Tax=Helicobacter suis TaxID=104628 RepID=UPI0013D5A8CC|nr:hypothetical protein [Helicobacter suis]
MPHLMLYCQMQGKIYKVSELPEGVWDFKVYDNCKEINYTPNTDEKSLEKGEVFCIQAPPETLKAYNLVIHGDTTSINTASEDILIKNKESKENTPKVLFVCVGERNKIKIYFQAIRQGSIIKRKFISFNDKVYIGNRPIILIQDHTDVYWSQETNRFYFKKIEDLERVFPDFFERKVQEAKQKLKSIKENLSYQYLRLDLNLDDIKSTMAKIKLMRIDFLLQKGYLELFKDDADQSKRGAYLKYAKKYKPQMIEDGKLVIRKVSGLDALYYVMQQSYYTTEIGEKEQRIATAFEKNSPKD